MNSRSDFCQCKRLVVKIGSSLLTDSRRGLNNPAISAWVRQIAGIRKQGIGILLVSSGSVAEGMCRLGWNVRPKALHELQAAASVGQMGLVQAYESHFQGHGLHTAQVLLTHEDLSNRKRYLNARSTLLTLLEYGVVPVINENDTVATEEIQFGDNDTLAALVANLIEAELMIILTDQAGLFDRDPSLNPDARLIEQIQITDSRLPGMAGHSRSGLGRGGMITKVNAAAVAARSGAATLIASGMESDVLTRILSADPVGTFLIPDSEPLDARKRWLAGQLQVKGRLVIDAGAVAVLRASGKSLLPVGVVTVNGTFSRGDLVACFSESGDEVARGLVNYGADEADKIKGQSSSRIEKLLGYTGEAELVHRNNLVLV
ncbi:MAG: glutamate 5-kinase [Methylococcaceae bacterium]|nr:glutamate 5-kinase [Methylococcaceae bacterium]